MKSRTDLVDDVNHATGLNRLAGTEYQPEEADKPRPRYRGSTP